VQVSWFLSKCRRACDSEEAKPLHWCRSWSSFIRCKREHVRYSEFWNMTQALHHCCGLPMLQPAAEIGCDP